MRESCPGHQDGRRDMEGRGEQTAGGARRGKEGQSGHRTGREGTNLARSRADCTHLSPALKDRLVAISRGGVADEVESLGPIGLTNDSHALVEGQLRQVYPVAAH